MTSLIIHVPKYEKWVNIESKTENRVDIGSKRTKSIAKLVNSLIFKVKKTRFATVFDHRKIANFYPNRLNFFFKPRRNLRRTRISRLENLDDKWTCRKSSPELSFLAVFLRFFNKLLSPNSVYECIKLLDMSSTHGVLHLYGISVYLRHL